MRLITVILAVASLCLASTAEARPRHKHKHHRHHRAHVVKGYQVASLGSFAGRGMALIMRARADIGKSAREMGLHRGNLWCAAALNRWADGGTGSDLARSYASYGSRGTGAVGDIAVFSRGRTGGHVGIITGQCSGGIVLISGNDGNRVRERCVSTARIIAYRRP